MTCDEQLERWVAGNSIHNDERDECCPDFSCCQSDLLADPAEREAFRRADGEARQAMLMTFLGRMFQQMGKSEDVYIAGDPANYKSKQ